MSFEDFTYRDIRAYGLPTDSDGTISYLRSGVTMKVDGPRRPLR